MTPEPGAQPLPESAIKRAFRWGDVGACLVLALLAVRLGARTALWYGGLLLTALTVPLWVVARLQLGRSFSVRPEARALVTHGLYSRIRHPVYLFGCLAYFGAFLALQIWPLLIVWLALVPVELVRARREDRVLREAFGRRYDDYRARTWF